jgi:hypothetical protein
MGPFEQQIAVAARLSSLETKAVSVTGDFGLYAEKI